MVGPIVTSAIVVATGSIMATLPMFYNLDMEDVKYITDTIASFDGF